MAPVFTHCAMVPQSPETCLWLPVAETCGVLIERQKRMSRVRFQHPIRVVTLDGQPRVIRTLTANVSRDGLFLRMPEPLPPGMKVALSLEAGGRALALAQAEVVWGEPEENELTERFSGCGVRFTEFMHPRAEELVQYLVRNLDQGKPLMLAPPERRWARWLPYAGLGGLLACAALAALLLWAPTEPEPEEAVPPALEMIAGTPTVHPVPRAGEPSLDSARDERGPVQVAPAAPVQVAPAAPVQVAPPAPASARAERGADQGNIKLPSGAALALKWKLSGNELRLSPELVGAARVTRAFVLSDPSRAVFDVSGDSPPRSLLVSATPPHSTGVRLGKQAAGTRIVVDLDGPPKRSTQDGASLVLSF